MDTVIELKKATKSFPGVRALKGFDLKIYKNEILGLVGENGAGKSTLMKVLIGMYQLDDGKYLLRGQPAKMKSSNDAIKEGVGMVFQEGCMLLNMTITENLFLSNEQSFIKNGILNIAKMREEAQKALAKVELKIDPQTPCSRLSPAQRQMVEIARLLWLSEHYGKDNPVMILDEPTTVLQQKEADTLFRILEDIKKHATIILISHRLEEVIENSDRIVVLKDGDYITEMPANEATEEGIEELMVGRNLSGEHFRESEQREPETENFLEVRNLTIDGVFEPISFTVKKGEILSLVGLIGSGKEELCQCLAGVRRPTGGEILINGKNVLIKSPKDSIRSRIGYIPIDRRKEGLATDFDVADNINMLILNSLKTKGFLNRFKEAANAKKWVKEALIKTPSIRTKCRNLSGGNQQKVVISKWLAAESQLLVLDHPTRGIDVGAKDEIYHRIRLLANEGRCLIMMCDTLEEDIGLCNRMLIMKDGKMVKTIDCPAAEKPEPLEILSAIV